MRRKTRKEKEATQRRYALQREKKQKIAKLKSEIIDCKELIKQGRIKNLKIYASRTIKTIGSFTLATLPFSLALALCSGLFCLGGVGVPFRMDSFKNYNCIQGSMDSNGNYSIVSEYDSSSKSEYFDADVFYPWEKKEDTYQRLVYKYDFDTSDSKLLNEIQKYIETC